MTSNRRPTVMNRYQKIAAVLLLGTGIIGAGVCLQLIQADVAAYRSMEPVSVTVQDLHIVSQNISLEDVGQAIQIDTEMTLATPKGLRIVWESVLLKPDMARARAAELEALRGRTVTLYLSDEAPHRFAFTRAFHWQWVIALALVLVVLVVPPALAIWVWMRRGAKAQDKARQPQA